MKPVLFRSLLCPGIIFFFVCGSFAQTFRGENGRILKVEVVQDLPCPLEITVDRVDLAPKREHIALSLYNRSTKGIRAYAMISGGDRYPNLHTVIFPGKLFAADTNLKRGIWPNSQEHYYIFFDFILFEDGSTCGRNNHNRYIQIANYLSARASAMAKLRGIVASYPNSDEFMSAVENTGSYTSFDNPGPPNPETVKDSPVKAYEHIIVRLREMMMRKNEARAIADRLENEMPAREPRAKRN